MNLLNRYLQAVAKLLPKARREDIIEELRINILAQMEDRAEELGRPLTEDEQAAILRLHGNPTVIAGRYRQDNLGLSFGRQWIGPELFPFYKIVLLVNMSITVLVMAIVIPMVAHFTGGAVIFEKTLTPLATQFVIVTLIFIAVDRNKEKLFDKWDPRKLPAVKASAEDGPTAKNIFEFICLVIGSLWLLFTPRWPYLMLGPGAWFLPALEVKASFEWIPFYAAIALMLGAQIVLDFLKLFRWLPRQKGRIGEAILSAAGLLISVLLLLKAPNYVASKYEEVAHWANLNFAICIAIAAGISAWKTGRILILLIRERHQMTSVKNHEVRA